MKLFSKSKPTNDDEQRRHEDPLLQESNEPKKSCFTNFCYSLA